MNWASVIPSIGVGGGACSAAVHYRHDYASNLRMTIVVTGCAGFIGTSLVRRWVEQCAETVINRDKLTYAGNPANLASLAGRGRCFFVTGDIADRRLVSDLLDRYLPRAVINLAAESHVDCSMRGPADFVQTSVVGTFHRLEEVRGYWSNLAGAKKDTFRFLHVSTDEVYGSVEADAPVVTDTPCARKRSPTGWAISMPFSSNASRCQ